MTDPLPLDRRAFLGAGAAAAGAFAVSLPTPRTRREPPGLEEIARLVTEEPADRVFAAAADLVRKRGVSYGQLLAGVLLAGVREIRPRPVGFKFHAVMMVGSAYQVARACAPASRGFPVFFNLADFKRSQERDRQEGDWRLGPSPEPGGGGDAESRLQRAMEEWDDDGADRAVVDLHRTRGLEESFELLWPHAARDFRNIGHKIIFAAQAHHSLQQIGWVHAEPVLRSLVNALLHRGDAGLVAPYERNRALLRGLSDGASGSAAERPADPAHASRWLARLREWTEPEAAEQTARALVDGVAPATVFDGLRLSAFEMLMGAPGILTVHTVTALNGFHRAWRATRSERTRRLLLLQATSWTVMFRDEFRRRGMAVEARRIDELRAAGRAAGADEVFDAAGEDRDEACRLALRLAQEPDGARAFARRSRELLVRKAKEHHDYKFLAAALEEAEAAHPEVAPRLLAASLSYLRHGRESDGPAYREAVRVLSA